MNKIIIGLLTGLGVAAALVSGYLLLKPDTCYDCVGHDMLGIEDTSAIDPGLIIADQVRVQALASGTAKAIAIGPQGDLYAASEKLAVYSPEGKQKLLVDLPRPVRCLAVDPEGLMYAGAQDRVMVLAPDGTVKAEWPAINTVSHLTSIAADGDSIWVADAGTRAVYHYKPDGSMQGLIDGITADTTPEGFLIPSPHFDLWISDTDVLWIVNPGEHLVQNYRSDGTRRSEWGTFGDAVESFCGCCNPTDIVLLSDGTFITSEKGLVRVKHYSQAGVFNGIIAGAESFTPEVNGLDLAVDSQDAVYVLDPAAQKVFVFSLKKEQQ